MNVCVHARVQARQADCVAGVSLAWAMCGRDGCVPCVWVLALGDTGMWAEACAKGGFMGLLRLWVRTMGSVGKGAGGWWWWVSNCKREE